MEVSREVSIKDWIKLDGFFVDSLPEKVQQFLGNSEYTVTNGVLEICTPDRLMVQAKPGDYLIKDVEDNVFPIPREMAARLPRIFGQ